MAKDDDIFSLVGQKHTIGLSSIVGISVIPGVVSVLVQYGTGGSLEIGGATLTWGQGFLFKVDQGISLDNAGTFYLAATGATVTAYTLRGRSAGIPDA